MKRTFSRKNLASGFTLVEVIVAMGLMALAMLAIAPLFVGGLKNNGVGWDYSSLNTLAKQQLEEILQYNFTDARLAVPTAASFNGNPGQSYRRPLVGPYELVYVVQDFPFLSIPAPGSIPNPANAVTDTNAAWVLSPGIKMITVYVASARSSLQGTAYSAAANTIAGLFPTGYKGKQIRMTAFKSP
jgi:prepilin-type N-terminal cleavage/methylation domain-containing protein